MSWKRLNGPTFLPSLGILLLEEETGFLILVCVCVGGLQQWASSGFPLYSPLQYWRKEALEQRQGKGLSPPAQLDDEDGSGPCEKQESETVVCGSWVW